MKTILLEGLAILPVAAMAAPSVVQLAAQPANQSTTFSTGAPVHSPWVVLQQATINASAGWNTNSTTTVVPSTTSGSFILNIQNTSSAPIYVAVSSVNDMNFTYPGTSGMCKIPANGAQNVSNYFTASQCLQAVTNTYNNYKQGQSPAYIYISSKDLVSGHTYSSSYMHCSGFPNPPLGHPFVINQISGTVTISVSLGGCAINQ